MKKILTFLLFIFIVFNMFFAAEEKKVLNISSIYNESGKIIVKGDISSGKKENITILLEKKDGNIAYINQFRTNSNGTFEIPFKFLNDSYDDQYTLIMGTSGIDNPKMISFYNVGNVLMNETEILQGTMTIDIKNYIPTIFGTFNYPKNYDLEMVVINEADNTQIVSNIENTEEGTFNFNYEIPSLLYPKNYNITVILSDDNGKLTEVELDISSIIISLSVDTEIFLEDNIRMEGKIESATVNSLNANIDIKESKNMSYTLPNIISNFSSSVNFCFYKKIPYNIENPSNGKKIYEIAVSGIKDNIYKLPLVCNNEEYLSSIFKITYDEEFFEIDATYIPNENIQIINNTDGIIEFKYNGKESHIDTIILKSKKSGNSNLIIYTDK